MAERWTNYDSVGHTVTSDEGDELDSERVGKDGTGSRCRLARAAPKP